MKASKSTRSQMYRIHRTRTPKRIWQYPSTTPLRQPPKTMDRFYRNIGSLINMMLRLHSHQTHFVDKPFAFNAAGISFFERPWICIKKESHPEAVFVLEKRNYKFYANLGLPVRSTKRFVFILDIGADSSFMRLIEIPKAIRYKICKIDSAPNVQKAI